MAELLALLGRSWSRLLCYPGGVGLLVLVLTLYGLRRLRHWRSNQLSLLGLVACTLPLLALALLPLPASPYPERDLDLLTVLLLLECPEWLRLRAALRAGGSLQQVAPRLAVLLNGYPVLLLAAAVMADAGSGLNLAALTTSSAWGGAIGAIAWSLALAPLLAPQALVGGALLFEAAVVLRTLGHVALAATLLVPLLPAGLNDSLRLVLALLLTMVVIWLGRVVRRYRYRIIVWEALLSALLLVWLALRAATTLLVAAGMIEKL